MADVATGAMARGARVRRRRVIYIPGYDPFPPRRYRELYRSEAAEQARISGYDLTLGPRRVAGPFGWHVRTRMDGCETETDIQVMDWCDLVRNSMRGSVLVSYAALLRTIWIYVTTGALFRLMRLRKGPVITAFYPVVMLLLQAGLAAALGLALGGAALVLLRLGLGAWGESPWGAGLACAAATTLGLWIVWQVLNAFKRRDARIKAYYLMHDYSYAAEARGANTPELEARMAQFADAVAAALAAEVDEVLVVGHSSGAQIGVSVLADLLRSGRVPEAGPGLGFLSLGHVMPVTTFLPDAKRLRRDLHELSRSPRVTWVDVTAPGDGCAFALCDPVAVSGVAPAEGKLWPLVFSAAFTKSLSPARWKALRWQFFRLHFQYLCAFDRPRDYDYFRITAGPLSLAARYHGRPPSRSRVEAPVNLYTEMA